MFDLFYDFEQCIHEQCDNYPGIHFKFVKAFKSHKQGDYNCFVPADVLHGISTINDLKSNIAKQRPELFHLIDLKITPHGLHLFFNRKETCLYGFKKISSNVNAYGRNNILINQMYKIFVDVNGDPRNLTELRVKLVADLLSSVISYSGGMLSNNDENHSTSCIDFTVSSRPNRGTSKTVVLVGPVLAKLPSASNTLEQYRLFRKGEVTSMCEHKLEINCDMENTEDLVNAVIAFDMLNNTVHRSATLLLEQEPQSNKSSCKGALFVVYNYVRLSAICHKFSTNVSSGLYPPLPSLDEIDFSLLSLEDEWTLVYDFILYWPSVVRKAVEDLPSGRPKLHLILAFLTSLASLFSGYYHRTRVLTEPRAHLLPTLYARIYMLQALREVFKNALNLLAIKPLEKM